MSTETPVVDLLDPADDAAELQTATIAPAETEQEESAQSADACPNCGSPESWGGASWCPKCGFYPKLNKCVGGGADESAADQEPATLIDVLPPWTWFLAVLSALA